MFLGFPAELDIRKAGLVDLNGLRNGTERTNVSTLISYARTSENLDASRGPARIARSAILAEVK
jgi:hypothetical protein